MEAFHVLLGEIREKSGYPSSRTFYNRNGGAKFFQCTYRHYLNIESGKAVPAPKQMEKIAVGLALGAKPEAARKLILAYLKALDMDGELIHLLSTTLAHAAANPDAKKPAFVKALAKIADDRIFNLTREQSGALVAKAENYWTFAVLTHDKRSWTPEDLAKLTGFTVKAHETALKTLEKLKLAKKKGRAGWLCPHAGLVFQHPDRRIFTVGLSALRKYRDDMTQKRGEKMLSYYFFSRGSEAALRQYFQYLIQPIQGADALSDLSGVPDSIFFEIETTVKKVLPF